MIGSAAAAAGLAARSARGYAANRAAGAALATLLACLSAVPAAAQAAHRRILDAKLQTALDSAAAAFPGVLGASVIDLADGRRFGVNDTLVFPQGSAIKIPILIELFRQADSGRLRLDERIEIPAAAQVGGSGLIQYFADRGSALSLHDLAVAMIVLSDNTATNLLISRIGMDRVNATMREIGAPHVRLQREMIRPRSSARGEENLATPAEAASIMARIAACRLPMSRTRCEALRAMLEIPKEGSFPRGVPVNVPIAWKPGGITGVATAWGLVRLPGRPYVVTVMTDYGLGGDDDAIEAVSRIAYEHFARLAGATPFGTRVPLELLTPAAADTSTRNLPGGRR